MLLGVLFLTVWGSNLHKGLYEPDSYAGLIRGYAADGDAPEPADSQVGFTGHGYDPESGLVYADARYYETALGRFLRRNHMIHHFANADANHGISSPLWDWVFRTFQARGQAAESRGE